MKWPINSDCEFHHLIPGSVQHFPDLCLPFTARSKVTPGDLWRFPDYNYLPGFCSFGWSQLLQTLPQSHRGLEVMTLFTPKSRHSCSLPVLGHACPWTNPTRFQCCKLKIIPLGKHSLVPKSRLGSPFLYSFCNLYSISIIYSTPLFSSMLPKGDYLVFFAQEFLGNLKGSQSRLYPCVSLVPKSTIR